MKVAIILLATAIPWVVAFPSGLFDSILGGGNKNHDDDCTDKHNGLVRSNIFFLIHISITFRINEISSDCLCFKLK